MYKVKKNQIFYAYYYIKKEEKKYLFDFLLTHYLTKIVRIYEINFKQRSLLFIKKEFSTKIYKFRYLSV
jgi:hypothetical protein